MIDLEEVILEKDHLLPFLRKLHKDAKLVAPLTNKHGDTLLSTIHNLDKEPIDLSRQPQNSLKSFFLPQQETLAHYNIDGDGYTFTNAEPPEDTIYFGIRSCDLTALLYMDLIFSKPAKDETYFGRRKKSLIITIGCNDPFSHCFCEATNSGPYLDYGYGLQFIDLGSRYYVAAGRSKGADILTKWSYFFREVTEDDQKLRYQLFLESRGRFNRNIQLEHACQILQKNSVDENIWKKLSSRCYDCGGCAYVCPTCTCFSVDDLPSSKTEGIRVRSWDACTSSGFTRMAGNHNPVDRTRYALQRRFLHKLKFDYKEHGKASCTGCGRCVDICFGGVDITSFIQMLLRKTP
jgi:formate hydrogenlyase subunit 6/NADH:ubiquinone oxidoreductase subunit I